MGLKEYSAKRNFKDTPEPKGKVHPSKGKLKFVIQRHQASHLHYDLRLEMEGVLKSWAVPKGPSLNPNDKRLAMQTEDHPLEYLTFKGIIPKGNYGAGVMNIWDKGTYRPFNDLPPEKQEKSLLADWHKGHLQLIFNGKNLKGAYDLFRKGEPENAWMLIKKNDEHAVFEPFTAEEIPPLTNVEGDKKRTREKKVRRKLKEIKLPDGAKEKAFPGFLEPMKAKLIDKAFSNDNWVYELKWDGYRALGYIEKGNGILYSRNGNLFKKYKDVLEALKTLPFDAILDGEIVALDKKGKPSFQLLQNYDSNPVNLYFYVFDILYFNGQSFLDVPLIERKRFLEEILPPSDVIVYSEHVDTDGEDIYNFAESKELEGVIAKRKDSTYQIGKRSGDWVKIKTQKNAGRYNNRL